MNEMRGVDMFYLLHEDVPLLMLMHILQVLDLVGFICASVGPCASCGAVTVFNLVAMLAFWISLVLLALYLFHVIEKLHTINWLLTVSHISLWEDRHEEKCIAANDLCLVQKKK